MTPDAKKKLIGAIIAAALAIAVYYGVIDQKQADNIRTQADHTLGTAPAAQQQTQQAPQPQTPQPAPAPQQSPAANQTPVPSPAPSPAPSPQH